MAVGGGGGGGGDDLLAASGHLQPDATLEGKGIMLLPRFQREREKGESIWDEEKLQLIVAYR